MLTDRVLDPKAYAANLDVQYEYMGQFDGECEAVAAWRKALRKATEDEAPARRLGRGEGAALRPERGFRYAHAVERHRGGRHVREEPGTA